MDTKAMDGLFSFLRPSIYGNFSVATLISLLDILKRMPRHSTTKLLELSDKLMGLLNAELRVGQGIRAILRARGRGGSRVVL